MNRNFLITISAALFAIGVFAACLNPVARKPSDFEGAKIESPAVPSEITNIVTLPTPETAVQQDGLVELVKLDNTIKLDIRYATANNFVGRIIYKEARAFLQRPAADSLVRIHQRLRKRDLGLVVFDGYRPLSATKLFWEVTPPEKKKYVANPKNGSRHNRGCAVDLGLFDIETGANLEMPTDFDDFTARAAIDYSGATETQKKNRETLRAAMEEDGFRVLPSEWWHFDFQRCPETRALDIQFSEIGKSRDSILQPEIAELFKKIVEQIRQPNFHTSDTVFVSLSGFVYELSTGDLKHSVDKSPKRCGNVVDVSQTLLDKDMRGLAGGGSLWRLSRGNWEQIGADESIGYQYDELLKIGVSKATLKCLGIAP
ncbi:MAG: M15 family metallopeptidase [Acidobacteria bacterium]|nr:M15 family metallopeptidase [Acidobacteriota bacterium]MBK8813695.1 M15 family metallopeptidase [Acidobacteriota bacterium]